MGGQWPESEQHGKVDGSCSISSQALTLKMRGKSLDWAWMTSEARTGVAENWGSLGGSQNRSEVSLFLTAPLTTSPLPHATAQHPPQIQDLQEGPAGRAEPRVRGVKQQQA